ncbi:MAG: hypothetical protein QHH12_06430 [Candidatus Bathyarchaeota archaeon]|nr:hypothetical protein [Candidatus Bathyarchaeota archaeon A05DMB-3]MDH7607381.1 hypothetical protein [Candidatus Bathyarchaeota archaeon]PMB75832.1 MAG: hypothetical protein C0193_00335 [Candidatus Bathyarchaeota archaeon]
MYAVWIRIDETLPWIELKGTYQTRKEAREAAKEFLSKINVKIVKAEKIRKQMKAVVAIKQ